MIGYLDDDRHERLWRICDTLVSGAGARAAMVCDASTGAVLVCVGDASARGAVSGVEALGPGERLVHGDGGEIYGVDIPGGALLAVLHDAEAVEQVRAAVFAAVVEATDLIAHLPPPPPPWPPVHPQVHTGGAQRSGKNAPRRKAASKKKPAPAPRKKRRVKRR